MRKPKTKLVKSKQIEEWIKEGRAVLRNDLRPEYMGDWSDYYLLDSYGLILRTTFERRNGILYERYSEYLDFMNNAKEKENLVNQIAISPNASFPGYIQVSVKEFESMILASDKMLASDFSISAEVLDYSLESLIYLDESVKKMLKKVDAGDFEEKYCVLISAYCGEVMRRKINGNWRITSSADGILDQVLIVEKANPEYSYRPEIPLALILSGDSPGRSNLKIEVDAQLHKYGFIKGNEAHYGIK